MTSDLPPKKVGAASKKKSKKKQLKAVDVKPLYEMTREELEDHVSRLRKELERERADRNLLQLERDKINTFWALTKDELKSCSGELRVAQETTQKIAERRENDLTAYRLRVRQIEASHANQLAEVKAEMEVAVGLAAQEAIAATSKPRLMEEALRKEAADHNELVKVLKRHHEKELTELRQNFEQQSEVERQLYMEKTEKLKERLDLQWRTQLQSIEERKNAQIEVLKQNHEKAFIEMKNYYHAITDENISLIDELKIQVEEKHKLENRVVKENGELKIRNQFLKEELGKYQKECANLKRLVENHERDVGALKNVQMEIKDMKTALSNAKMDNEILHQRLKSVEIERSELSESFKSAIGVVKQSCEVKNVLLAKKLASASEELEKFKIKNQIREDEMTGSHEAEKVISTKDRQIKELHLELAKVYKAYNDAMWTFKQKMTNYGIKAENLNSMF